MPTGYTSRLDDTEKSSADWIVEDLSRAFVMCIMLREESMNLTFEQILERIKSDSNYHIKALATAKAEFIKLAGLSETEWKELMDKENSDIAESNRQSVVSASEHSKVHKRAMRDLRLVMNKTKDEITQNVCRFGLEQLELVKSECSPYISELHNNLYIFKMDKLKNSTREVAYHEKELKETEERNNSRVQAFITLRDEVNKILKKE